MSKHKLLLADDSITIQKVVNLTFADEGIEVVSVGDGNAAIEKLSEFTPDLVMVDINMPGLSGYEICERIRANQETSRVPVILLVGSFEPFDEAEAQRVGANDFLTKPFQSIRQLVTKVSGLLDASNKNSTDEIISDMEKSVENKVPGEFENTLEMETPSGIGEEFGDSGMDDEMIQTNQIAAVEEDDRITQPLSTAEFDEIHGAAENEISSVAEEERGYAFVSETPFSPPTAVSEDITDKSYSMAETEPLPQSDDFYQTQRIPTIESEDEANLLELPPQVESLSNSAFSSRPVWQEEIAPISETIENEPIPETTEVNQFAPTFETPNETPEIVETVETVEETQVESNIEAVEKAQSVPEAVIESEPESAADETAVVETEGEALDIREAPTDEMIDLSQVEAVKTDETSNAVTETLNLSPEVIEAIAAKVSEKFSDRVLRELVEELKPQITEMIAKRIAE